MPTRHDLSINRQRVAAMLLVLVACVSSVTSAQNATKTGQQAQKSTKQPAARPTYRENLSAGYETIRMSKPDGSVVLLRVPRQQRWPGPVDIQGRRTTNSGPTGRASIPLSISSELVPALYGVHGVRISLPYTGTRTIDTGTPLRDLLLQHGGHSRVGTPAVAGDDPTEWRTGLGWVPGGEGDDSGDYLSNLTPEFPVLEPGNGWDGPTQDPPPVGNEGDPGWDAKAIARWDVVPYQTITEDFHIGVVAFHINGIDRVEFSVDGGPWVAVREMQLNPRTGVWEYTVILRPELFAEDGLVEVRAVVWPSTAGEPRVLGGELDSTTVDLGEHSLFLSTNFLGTLPEPVAYVSVTGSDSTGDGSEQSPFRSIMKAAKALETISGTGLADGGTVYLMPGDYSWGPARYDYDGNYIGMPALQDRFLTVARAPGATRDQVRITQAGSGGILATLLHVSELTWHTLINNDVRPDTHPLVWADSCNFVGGGPTELVNWIALTKWTGGRFATNCTVSNSRYGFSSALNLGRDLLVRYIGDSPYTAPGMLVNCRAQNCEPPAGSGYHTDILQFHASEVPIQNRIVYGLEALDNACHGFMVGYTRHIPGPDWTDIALVNVLFDVDYTKQWAVSANHVLWWNLTVLGGPVLLTNTIGDHAQVTSIRNFSMRNSVFNVFGIRDDDVEPSLGDQSWAASNHFMDLDTYGSRAVGADYSTGGSLVTLFSDPSGNDFRANPAGQLANRVTNPVTVSDVYGTPLAIPAAIGAAQPLTSSE